MNKENTTQMDGLRVDPPPSPVPAPPTPDFWEQLAAELNSLRKRTADLEANITWLREMNDEVLTTNAKLNDKLDALTKTVYDQSAVIDHFSKRKSSEPNEIKGNDPPVFEGAPRELDPWVLALRLKFSLQPSKFTSEETKVQYAITFLKGPPKAWANPLASRFLTERGGVPEFASFETFVTSIRALYGDPNIANHALNSLKTIKQTTSVSEFYSRFVGFSQYTKLCDDALRSFFYDGLKDTIKDELATKDCPTLASLKTMAIDLDSRLQERKWEREHLSSRKNPDAPLSNGTRLTYPRPPPTQPAPIPPRPHQAPAPYHAPAPPRPPLPRPAPPPVPAAPGGPTPMELDSQRLRPLTEAEREQCLREGRCLRCRLPGHMARDCPGRFAMSELEIALSENGESQE
jgi:Retrotransposon gag protein